MKEKILRFFVTSLSSVLLLASVGIIFWIGQDEQERLALKERSGLLANENAEKRIAEEKRLAEEAASIESADKTLNDIDALLSALSLDDLPPEE